MAETKKRNSGLMRSGMKRAAPKKRARKAAAGSRGLLPAECALEVLEGPVAELRARIEKEGGAVLAAYRDPLWAEVTVDRAAGRISIEGRASEWEAFKKKSRKFLRRFALIL